MYIQLFSCKEHACLTVSHETTSVRIVGGIKVDTTRSADNRPHALAQGDRAETLRTQTRHMFLLPREKLDAHDLGVHVHLGLKWAFFFLVCEESQFLPRDHVLSSIGLVTILKAVDGHALQRWNVKARRKGSRSSGWIGKQRRTPYSRMHKKHLTTRGPSNC